MLDHADPAGASDDLPVEPDIDTMGDQEPGHTLHIGPSSVVVIADEHMTGHAYTVPVKFNGG